MSLLTNEQLGPAVWLGPFAESSDPVTDILASLDRMASIEASWQTAASSFGWLAPADALPGSGIASNIAIANEITDAQQKVDIARGLIGSSDVFASVTGAQAYNDALAAYAQTRADLATDPQQISTTDTILDDLGRAATSLANLPDRLGISVSLPSWGQVGVTIVAICAVYFVVRRIFA